MPSWVFIFVILSDYVAMYLSFAFVSKQYRCLFAPFKNICYSACNELCFYCCCINQVSEDLELEGTNKKSNPGSDHNKESHLDLPYDRTSNPMPCAYKLSSNSLMSDMSYMSSSLRKYSVPEHQQRKIPDMLKCHSSSDAEHETELEMAAINCDTIENRVDVDEIEIATMGMDKDDDDQIP